MVDFQLFHFAAPPRCASTWFLRAAALAGLPHVQAAGQSLIPHEFDNAPVLKVSLVCNPCDWLASYWANVWPRRIGVPVVDRFASLPGGTFDDFIWAYLAGDAGTVGQMFAAYNADSFIRVEDLPHGMTELLQTFGVARGAASAMAHLRRLNVTAAPPEYPDGLQLSVRAAEAEMCEQFNYWG